VGRGRGRLTSAPDRRRQLDGVEEAVANGARRWRACEEAGISDRTYQRWSCEGGLEDGRSQAVRASPAHALSAEERAAIVAVVNTAEFASLPPSQIVPKLADRGEYLGSESSFYRVLKAHEQTHRRGRSRVPQPRALTTHEATGPNQLWCWDITWLPTTVRGMYFDWYMFEDVFSRKLVASEVYAQESAEWAAHLLARACLSEQTAGRPLVLHSDNGSAMKGATMLARMQHLGVAPSFSRPRMSNDNAYAESLFRTAKYSPMWPERPFETLEQARTWVQQFVAWYNQRHQHSGLKYVTPEQRHRGDAPELLRKRDQLYREARSKHPRRWSGKTRDWTLASKVYLNPERASRGGNLKTAA
jgi:putative transposase